MVFFFITIVFSKLFLSYTYERCTEIFRLRDDKMLLYCRAASLYTRGERNCIQRRSDDPSEVRCQSTVQPHNYGHPGTG